MSSKPKEKVGSSLLIIEEDSQALPLSPAYESAMEALSSLITLQKRGQKSDIGGKYKKLDRMSMYTKILGLEEHIAGLKIIHVAGTKGKSSTQSSSQLLFQGSTCTFCEAILRECGLKTGLFTSPHLIDVRERFRLDGLEISEESFLLYFWDCWNQLKEKVSEDLPMPPLFQFLTLLALKIFVCEKVDVAIVEVGLGGKNDSTNVIKEPVVCGIASLGMDHVEILGDTLGQIASHKAGIFKPQVPAFTVPQLSEAMDVLQERAQELMMVHGEITFSVLDMETLAPSPGISHHLAFPWDNKVPLEVSAPLDDKKLKGLKLSLSGDHQLINAGLAVSLSKSWLRSTGKWEKLLQNDCREDNLPEPFLRGLSTARLSGRAQIVHDVSSRTDNSSEVSNNSSGGLIFYLDGAHSPESMEACARWFLSAVKENRIQSPVSSSSQGGNQEKLWGNGYVQHGREKESQITSKQILLFNCMEVRDPQILLSKLVNTCGSSGSHFSKAIFVPSMSTYNKVTSGASFMPSDITTKDLSWQFNLQRIWEKIIHGNDAVLDKSSKSEAIKLSSSREFLYEDISHCHPANGYFGCSTVIPSLPRTINWLRDCARGNPSLRIQVRILGNVSCNPYFKLMRFC
ncbi:hypothetical protein RJ639_047080 [Escallonia herrerae]|uniref:Folylpolyglutamate synthase n=1 Tax=Escallonia herrerae TaxID=1293975 RepID=A0AA88W780_9ASTE|nr:hypothetical protein RJ639_047080 [Escallonia herrerae]